MPEKKTSKSGRLGTQMRGALANAYDKRGHLSSDLFYAYSPRMDKDVVLSGALQFGHFLLVESDPNIVRVDYEPTARITLQAGEAIASLVNAEVVDSDGALLWHEVKASRALERSNAVRTGLQLGIRQQTSVGWPSDHRVFTELDIYANPLRIRNWNREVSWMAQARHFPLLEERRQVFEVIRKKRSIVLAEVLSLVTEERKGLVAAALFKAVQGGRVQSDLDIAPLEIDGGSSHTQLRLSPPSGYESWLVYAAATFDARPALLHTIFDDTSSASRDRVEHAVRVEFNELPLRAGLAPIELGFKPA